MKTRNFIAVLVLMLGAFSMVIGQKTYYKVDRVESYIVDNVTKQPNLTNVFNKTNVVSLDMDNMKVNLFVPNTDKNFTLRLYNVTLNEKSDGSKYATIDAYDNESSYFRVFYAQDSITLSYNNGSDIIMIVYYTKEI